MKKWFLFYLSIVSCLSQTGYSAESQSHPDDLEARIDALFAEWNKPNSPGGAVAVIRDGTVVLAKGYGLADVESKAPNTSQTVFNLASCSKQFTAACIALLAEDGKLSLDDDIRNYLPEFPVYDKPVTIRSLIHHTSGIRTFDVLFLLAGSDADTLRNQPALFDLLCRQPRLNFLPGEQHMYSNSGYFLLSMIVQRITGQTLAEFSRRRIFEPLGMTNTVIYEHSDQEIPGLAFGHSTGQTNGSFRVHRQIDPITGNSNVFSSVEDLAKWERIFYETRIGGKDFIHTLQTKGRLNNGQEVDYAFGLSWGEHKGLLTLSHQGGDRGVRAFMVQFPNQRFSVICLANIDTLEPVGISYQIADLFLNDCYPPEKSNRPEKDKPKPERKEMALTPSAIERCAGKYMIDEESTFHIVPEEGKLFITGTYQPKTQLHSTSEREFFLKEVDAVIAFTGEESGKFTKMVFRIGGFEISACRVPYGEPSESDLRDYSGEYYSEEILSTYKVELRDGKLYLRTPIDQKEFSYLRMSDPLTHDIDDRFGSPIGPVAFDRDAQGRVCGLDLVNLGRIQHVKFKKR